VNGRGRVGALACLVALAAAARPGPARAEVADPADQSLPAVVRAIAHGNPVAPSLPANPQVALASAVDNLGAVLGFRLDAAPAIERSAVPPAVAGRLAVLLGGLTDCYVASGPARDLVARMPGAADAVASLRFAAVGLPIRDCAARLVPLAVETAHFLRAAGTMSGGGLDLWPVLRWEPSDGGVTYVNDYALLVAQGGKNTFANNVGGNLLDVVRGPDGSPARVHGRARGCHTAVEALLGQPELPTDDPVKCVFASALLIDAAGGNTFGQLQDPDPADDGLCTASPVVRRIATAGAGLAGVGILVAEGGNNKYVGKYLALGSGHFGGVGVLIDEGGHNSFLAVHNSEGYGLIGGLGVLQATGGDNTYGYYVAEAGGHAANGSVLPGGIINDVGLCDALPRMLQGTSNLPGSLGVFIAGGDHNQFHGTPTSSIGIGPSVPNQPAALHFGSQGFGGDGGAGYFRNSGNGATYTGVAGHRPGATVNPSAENLGYFKDDGRSDSE